MKRKLVYILGMVILGSSLIGCGGYKDLNKVSLDDIEEGDKVELIGKVIDTHYDDNGNLMVIDLDYRTGDDNYFNCFVEVNNEYRSQLDKDYYVQDFVKVQGIIDDTMLGMKMEHGEILH